MLHLFLGQRGRRLIKYNDFRVIRDSLGDLHHLSLGNGHRAHDPLRVDVDAKLFKNRFCIAEHLRLVDDNARDLRIPPEPEVVHDRPFERLIEFLMHHGDAVHQRLLAAVEVDLAALEIDVAAVLVVNAEQAFHQCRFACAVLAHERVDGSGLDLETDVIQCPDAREGLGNIRHPEQHGLFHLIPS